MFDTRNNTTLESNTYNSLKKTDEKSFFVLALNDDYYDQDTLEKEGAVPLQNLYGENATINDKRVDVIQIQLLNNEGTKALCEVRYVHS